MEKKIFLVELIKYIMKVFWRKMQKAVSLIGISIFAIN